MRAHLTTAAAVLVTLLGTPPSRADDCKSPDAGLGVARIVEIDTTAGPLYGDMSKLAREPSFLGPKEVVLTFDDGPMPWITKSILDTLDRFCTKATFFSVGRMAIAYPASVKDVMARGHTLGTHTWSHPLNLRRSGIERARDEIERGFAAVSMAAGQPIAPFFRFPGLSDSDSMMAHLQTRAIAAFTVDVVSNDSYIGSPARLTERTISHTVARDGGILLFHDIKSVTAKALPEILSQLKSRGFKVVHLRPKATYTPLAEYDVALQPLLAKATSAQATTKASLVPFYGTTGPEKPPAEAPATATEAAEPSAPITALAPAPRERANAPPPAKEPAATAALPRQERAVTRSIGPRYRASTPRVRRQRHAQPKPQPSGLFIFD
jgi:peptidoglycan/xylan/chitin deacetylase (PgdA/CDA1 family)